MADDEWDEEETTVLVELNGLTDSEFFKKENVACKILGVDSDKPLLQLGTNLFSGEYQDVLGTCLIFDKNTDPDETNIKSVKFHSKTQKTLVMHRTFLNEKSEGVIELCKDTPTTEQTTDHTTVDKPQITPENT
ncbi:hypothetical protein SNE40_012701 [Patella caerulea]|uniref:Transcription factor TFIIIC triple barrel domain-containing protein n=1 Tax=Patella caerulea TaxID=87958 RepID=A0AAN8Q1T6_PATCE